MRHRPNGVRTTILIVFLVFVSSAHAQSWPQKIRGYKVHDAKVSISNSILDVRNSDKADASVRLSDPKIADLSLTGVTIEIGAEVTSAKQSGSVDFVTFKDISVNGFAVGVEDYLHPFNFKKGEPTAPPKPARITLRVSSLPRAAYNELVNSKKELTVTGTAFVFGKFKKMGFNFKRVVPVKIDLKVKNPLR